MAKDVAGIGRAIGDTAKATSEYYQKEIEARIKRAQFERDTQIAKIKGDVDLTNLRQKQFTKRHKTLNESIQTFRNTADEIINSLDKTFARIDFTTKGGKKVQLEFSPLSLSMFQFTYIRPLLAYMQLETNDSNLSDFFYTMYDSMFTQWEWFRGIANENPDAFKKSVAAGTYYNPPLDPDISTDAPGTIVQGLETYSDKLAVRSTSGLPNLPPIENMLEDVAARYLQLVHSGPQLTAAERKRRLESIWKDAAAMGVSKDLIQQRAVEMFAEAQPVFE